jgi:MFS family permease
MLQAARLLLGLVSGQVGLVREHTKARATYLALLAVFGLAAAVFLLVFVTAALADWLGLLPALALMAGVFLVAALIVVLRMQAEQRRHERAKQLQRADQARVAQTALLAALPVLRRGGIVTAGLGGLVLAVLLARRSGRRRDRGD